MNKKQEKKNTLPIHFFTIVLNGMPFIEYHIEAFTKLPFRWHWHIIEGVAALKHDTAWSKEDGGHIPAQLHHEGRSVDGTSEYIDGLCKTYPNAVRVYRKERDAFWDGKVEMVNAPLCNINEECLLWEVDTDELWTSEQICACQNLFISEKEASAAYFWCDYFVGPDLVISSRNTYGNYSTYEWLRTWRYKPGDRWMSHEPPCLSRSIDGKNILVHNIKPLMHAITESKGLVFQHYPYVYKEQLAFKEEYYGYTDAIIRWERLQEEAYFPRKLREYFSWVPDDAEVTTVSARTIIPVFDVQEKKCTNRGNDTYVNTLPTHFVLRCENMSEVAAKVHFSDSEKVQKKVLVISHERSGTHFLINAIAANSAYYRNDIYSMLGNSGELCQMLRFFYDKNEKRIFKSHHAYEYYEPFIDELLDYFHIFYIYRDGRDVMNSCFHYFNSAPVHEFPHTASMAAFLKIIPHDYLFDKEYSYYKSNTMVERWQRHITGWFSIKDRITTISYEQLHTDFISVVNDIRKTLREDPVKKYVRPGLKEKTVASRRGVIGDWKKSFTADDLTTYLLLSEESGIEKKVYDTSRR